MRKLYISILFIFFLTTTSINSFGQIVAYNSEINADCGNVTSSNYMNIMYNVMYNDLINGSTFTYTDVTLTVIDNPYSSFFSINTDITSPDYGFVNFYTNIFGEYTITYQICETANPTNCDIGYVTIYNYESPVICYPDDFTMNPISNTIGGTTNSVLNNDFYCNNLFYDNISITGDSSTGINFDNYGSVVVQIGATPGFHILNYTACPYITSNCGSSYAVIYVFGDSNIIANYDNFSSPNYPNTTTTASVLDNDTLNGAPVTLSNVTLTPLNVPEGFTLNANGTIGIGDVSEGTYNIPYQICDSSNPSSCYVNYAYVVVLKNRILGKVKFDSNSDGCDVTDAYINSVQVKNVNGSTTYTSNISYSSQYYLIGDFGTNTISLTGLPSYFTVTPANQVFNFSTPGTTVAPDFCITSNTNVDDLTISLIPLFNVVPGLPALYSISIKNNGSTALSGQVTFEFDSTKMSFLSSSPSPNVISGNQLTYNFATLNPFQRREISNIKFQVAIPPTVDLGDLVTFTGLITPISSDATPANNTSTVSQTVVNSQDPNDIIVHEGDAISLVQAQQDYLHYTIRFQNIGTSDAINIKVVNDLDSNLDWSTFELVSTSHPCRVKNNNSHNEYLFEGVYLPGTNNEPLSHGYVSYRIKPITTIAIGDVIPNTASIYFDYNAPIVTNTAITTVSNLSNLNFAFTNFNYYPNPVKNSLSISNSYSIDSIEITSILGQTIITKSVNDLQTEINLSELSNGIYFVKVISQNQEKTIKIIKE